MKSKLSNQIAYGLIIIFIIIFTWLSFWRHDSLQSYLNDLGSCDQIIWNIVHGHFFDNSSNMLGVRNYLSAHFSLIMLFFAPFYAIIANPKWLLFFQALAVGLGAVPVYLLAKEKSKNYWVALVFLSSYLLNPFLQNALLYDFHEVVLAVGFASWAFYFLEKKNNRAFIICSILLALSQEHLALLVFMMGLHAFFIQKRRKFGFWVSVISLAYFISTLAFFMPHFSQTGKLAILEVEGSMQYGNRYAWLGSSMPEIIKNIVYHPIIILKTILIRERFNYLFYLILPVFSLSFYAWPIMIILPIFFINILSSVPMTFDIFSYHSAIAIPFIYFSASMAFGRWFSEDKFLRRLFLLAIIVASLVSFRLFSLVGIAGGGVFAEYRPDAHARGITEVKKIIPAEAELSVQNNLGPHFSERAEIYRFPLRKEKADYVILDTTNPYREGAGHFAQLDYALQIKLDDWQKYIDELMESQQHDLIYQDDGYLVFKKKP
jgi:uncharacterized membrane protein